MSGANSASTFHRSEPLVGTLEAFAVYARWVLRYSATMAIASGRKSTLIATLMLMGIATFLVSLVPTYESIGLWGAVIPASGARRCACWARRR